MSGKVWAVNSEPAFPSANDVRIGDVGTSGHTGMTLRDYFAAHCPGDICNTEVSDVAGKFIGRPMPDDDDVMAQAQWSVEVEAKMRYLYADAMLAERAK